MSSNFYRKKTFQDYVDGSYNSPKHNVGPKPILKPFDSSKMPLIKDFDIKEFDRILKENAKNSKFSSGETPFKPIKPLMEFRDSKGRIVKYIETSVGSISVQIFVLPSEPVEVLKRAIEDLLKKKNILNNNIKYSIDALKELKSVNILIKPQKLPIGFKKMFKDTIYRLMR